MVCAGGQTLFQVARVTSDDVCDINPGQAEARKQMHAGMLGGAPLPKKSELALQPVAGGQQRLRRKSEALLGPHGSLPSHSISMCLSVRNDDT